MSKFPKNPRGQIVAAVAFDQQTETIVRTVSSLARHFEMGVHLVSVVEPTLANPWIQLSGAQMAYFPIYPDVDEADRQDKLARMVELARRFELPFPVTTSVAYGLKAQTIISEAIAKRATVLVTGFDPESYRLSLTGMSTALMLLADAPLPVLAVTAGAAPDFDKPRFKVLIADDLTETTQEAVRNGYEIASELEQAEVRQTYVHGDFRELLRSRWEEFVCRFPGKDCGTLTPDSLWENEFQTLLAQAKAQGSPFRKKAEIANVKITLDVRTGTDVPEEFRAVAKEFAPDLVVFGRHRLLRSRPFLIGRMPFRTMLQMRQPILVVPPTGELYARLPFPASV